MIQHCYSSHGNMLWFYIDRLSSEMSPWPHKIKWVNNALNINVLSFPQRRFPKSPYTSILYIHMWKNTFLEDNACFFAFTSHFWTKALKVSGIPINCRFCNLVGSFFYLRHVCKTRDLFTLEEFTFLTYQFWYETVLSHIFFLMWWFRIL